MSARAERVAVLGSILVNRTADVLAEAARARRHLVLPLRGAVEEGCDVGVFRSADPTADADLIAALTMEAAGLGRPRLTTTRHDRATVASFCLRALGVDGSGPTGTA